jgi:hypothetical protein
MTQKPDTEAIERGVEMARANTWESIVEKLENHIADAVTKSVAPLA